MLFALCSLVAEWAFAQAGGKSEKTDKLDLVCFTGAWARGASVGLINPDNGAYLGPQTAIKADSFRISQAMPEPRMYILAISNIPGRQNPTYYNVFLSNERVVMTISGAESMPQISEGVVAQSFQTLVNDFGGYFDRLSQLNQQLQSAGTMGYSADSLRAMKNEIANRVGQAIPGFLAQYPNTPVSPFLLNLVWGLSYPLSSMETWVGMIKPEAMQNIYGESIKELINTEKLTGFGQVAPLFEQNDPDGKPVKLAAFRGKYVLIDFWASWCGPCRMENPAVVAAYQRFKNKNFTILGVSLDRDRQKWLEAVEKDKLEWTQVSDLGFWNNAVAKLYRVSSIPQNFLLDPEGKIIGKNLRGAELSSFLEQVLPTN